MAAAGVSGIPHAFIVDAKGIIRHHGHPMDPRFAQVLQTVSRGGGEQVAGELAAVAGTGPGTRSPHDRCHPRRQVCSEALPQQQQASQQQAAHGPPPKVTKTREQLLVAPVRELKGILDGWGVGYRDLHEKSELVDRILERCK